MYAELGDLVEFLDDYVLETNELLEQLDQDLLMLEERPDPAVINRIFRAFHTIKGTSGFLSFIDCMELAHSAEDVLNGIRNQKLQPSEEIVDVLLRTVDWFIAFNTDVAARIERSYDISELQAALKAVLSSHPVTDSPSGVQVDQQASQISEVPSLAAEIPSELVSEFVTESHELIETVGNEIMSLEIEPDNQEIIGEIFRVFHTLKGNAALMGLQQLAEVAHKAEDVLTLVRELKIIPDTHLVDTLLHAIDYMRAVLEEVRNDALTHRDTSVLLHDLKLILGEHDEPSGQNDAAIVDTPAQVETQASPGRENTNPQLESTLRVPVQRLDQLLNTTGELVTVKNQLQQLTELLQQSTDPLRQIRKLEDLNTVLAHLTQDLQERVMQMRMQPISSVFRKFPRMVRDLAKQQGKSINLVIFGDETELDRSVIEAIGDPLVHLLRNALDHGIELPATREDQDKPSKGTISLAAFQEGHQIVIKIKDDGRGIDPQIIQKKSIEQDLVSPEAVSQLSPAEILNLIFIPGFSTARKITEISGRGVGLDVVKASISKLNGSIEIDSAVGRGTEFSIRLPLTLTIMRGLEIRVVDEIYIIPLAVIAETLRLFPDQVSTQGGQDLLQLREMQIPLVYLQQFLSIPSAVPPTTRVYIVVVTVAGHQLGLVVSELLGQAELVVKPLSNLLGQVAYCAGATLRGDGQVALILDIAHIMDQVETAREVLV